MLRARWTFQMAVIGAVAIAASSSGCGAPPEQAKDKQPVVQQPAQPTVFNDTVETLDRARAVQGTVDERARDLEQAEQQAPGR